MSTPRAKDINQSKYFGCDMQRLQRTDVTDQSVRQVKSIVVLKAVPKIELDETLTLPRKSDITSCTLCIHSLRPSGDTHHRR